VFFIGFSLSRPGGPCAALVHGRASHAWSIPHAAGRFLTEPASAWRPFATRPSRPGAPASQARP